MRRIIFILALIAIVFSFGGCKVGRYLWYNFSNITDYKIFPSRPLHGSSQPFKFFDAQNNLAVDQRIKITDYAGVTTDFKSFIEYTSNSYGTM